MPPENLENLVFDAVRDHVLAYCDDMADKHLRAELRQMRVAVRVYTSVSVDLTRTRRYVVDTVRRAMNGAAAELRPMIRPQMGTGYVEVMTEHHQRPATPTPAEVTPGPSWLRVTILFGTGAPWEFEWEFDLRAAAQWAPVGRDIGGAANGIEPILIPAFVRAVPRGALLGLRYWQGRAQWLRSHERPTYGTWVDGRPLKPGHVAPAASAGRIEYRGRGVELTVLSYQLTSRVDR